MTEKKERSEAVPDGKQTQDKGKGSTQTSLILEVKPTIIISDGKHEGIIVDVKHRVVPFGYIDVIIREKKTHTDLKLGFPDTITEKTGLGKFLTTMGAVLKVGTGLDLNKFLLGRPVVFMCENEETEKGDFVIIVASTVKPID